MTAEERRAIEGCTLVLFDGLCGLCNRMIRFLIRRDPAGILLFAPLESTLGRELNPFGPTEDGIVVIEAALTVNQVAAIRSDAAIRILRLLPGGWPVAGFLLSALPRAVRDAAYAIIARSRYKLFGRYAQCPIPSATERRRLVGGAD